MREPFELALRILDLRRYARLKEAVALAEAAEQEPPRGWEEVWRMRAAIHGEGSVALALSPEETKRQATERELFG